MRFLTYTIAASLSVALLQGCGELSYKRGGSAQDIEKAHRTCRGSGDQLSACLAEQGWSKPKIDAFDPLFATVETTDNRDAANRKPSPLFVSTEELNHPKPSEQTAAAEAAPSQVTPATQTAFAEKQIAPTINKTEESDQKTEVRSTIHDGPEVTYQINSWWKMGAFPKQLKQDQMSCEKKLGTDFIPDYKTQTFKRAFVSCMHDLGWMAVRNIQ